MPVEIGVYRYVFSIGFAEMIVMNCSNRKFYWSLLRSVNITTSLREDIRAFLYASRVRLFKSLV
jgi:hypothetical protein